MKTYFALPTFIDENTDFKLMKEARNHLYMLDEQICAFAMLNIFKKIPELESFSFECSPESNDEGGTTMYLNYNEIHILPNSTKTQKEVERLLSRELSEMRDDDCESFFYDMSDNLINQNNVESLVEKAMGEKSYKKWQEAKIFAEKEKLEKSMTQPKNYPTINKL